MPSFHMRPALLTALAVAAFLAGSLPARAASFTFAVYGRGNPSVKVEVSAEGYRRTNELAADGRTSFDVPGSPKTLYYWIEGCGKKTGGIYVVNGTIAARLDVDSHCSGTIHSNQENAR